MKINLAGSFKMKTEPSIDMNRHSFLVYYASLSQHFCLIWIPGATSFSVLQWVWNGVHPALVRVNEELLE
jgi:hypothetical protein